MRYRTRTSHVPNNGIPPIQVIIPLIIILFPLAIGVVGALLLPVWAAIGAIAALVTNCTIAVERRED